MYQRVRSRCSRHSGSPHDPEDSTVRDREVDALLTAFDRTVAGGRPELVLVSGYSPEVLGLWRDFVLRLSSTPVVEYRQDLRQHARNRE